MRKQIFYGVFIILACLIFLSCKKNEGISNDLSSKPIYFFSPNKEIADAKDFFESQITSFPSQRFKKTPIWERAYNAKMASGAEKVIVPLKYDKSYNFKTSFSGSKQFSLEEQSFLSVYKDVFGNYQANVITIYPDESSINNTNQPFQGLLTIDDWNENRIKTYLHKDGKLYNIKKSDFNLVLV